jgi:YNFM family putative membrane transporter
VTTPEPRKGIARGDAAFRRASRARFLLHCVQPLLPVFAQEFHVSPAESSLPLSLATALLAIAIMCAAVLSEGFGRRNVMFASMASAAVMTVAAAVSPEWRVLLA